MSITISEERIKQIRTVIHNWNEDFSTDISHEEALEGLKRDMEPDVEWYDHGFQLCRVGHEAILSLRKGFHYCNQPFRSELIEVLPTAEGAAVQKVWHGVCKNDIIRNGNVIVKGTGKQFKCHVGFFVKINEAGKIYKIDEYDRRNWDECNLSSTYKRMEGPADHK